jgi:putative CocE/NonD family hydrolase
MSLGETKTARWLEGPFPPADKFSGWEVEQEIFVEMRDGVRLSTDVFLPKGATGRLPTVLVRTPYNKGGECPTTSSHGLRVFLRQGYAVVLQDERGRFFSEGDYENYLQGAGADGYDTVEWIVRQPWSNGKVGTIGCSSPAEHQWPLAAGNHPGHAAMIPAASGTAVGDIPGNETRGCFYRGGVPYIGSWAFWYGAHAVGERPVLPRDSSQEQRIRLRASWPLKPGQFDVFKVDRTGEVPVDPSRFAHLPSREILRELGGVLTPFDKYITWTPTDPGWDEVEHIGAGAEPRVPALHINNWHDMAIVETTRLFKYLQDLATPDHYLIIGAGPHCCVFFEETWSHSSVSDLSAIPRLSESESLPFDFADLSFGDLELGDVRYGGVDHGYAKLFLAWFEHWLNGEQNGVTEMPKVQLYVMGQGWITGDQWPLKDTRFTKYYLDGDPIPPSHETGVLSISSPNRNGKDSYVYDPAMPVPSRGGGHWWGVALDQRPVEIRKDVLVYSTPPLEQPVTIAGPIEVVLYISSSAKDTDFMVKLVDVYPDGKAINLCEDAFRVRYREGFDRKLLMEPGEVYKITLPNMVTAIRFPAGHRIRLQVSSSNFPLSERNLNTGGNNFDETTWVVAENSVHDGPEYPSHILLPVLPD